MHDTLHDTTCDAQQAWHECFSSIIGRPDCTYNHAYTYIYDVNRHLQDLVERPTGVAEELREWRDRYDIAWYKDQCRKYLPSYSVGVFSSGGCCDTLASIRAGFTPVWGSECCPIKNRMFSALTGTECYPDTFAHDWSNARHVTLLKSGQTCIDYSLSGPYFRGESGGRDGKTGWMFVKQVDPILTIQPTAFVLEMVS